jgi:5'-deoxynucleotidase YfbR-like HD superfamily hydrolase
VTAAAPQAARPATGIAPGVHRLTPLLGELSDLKRVRVAGRAGSLAEQAFRRGWQRLIGGEPVEQVALAEAASAVAAARLAGIDALVLQRIGVDPLPVLQRGFDAVADHLPDAAAAASLRRALAAGTPDPIDEAPLPPGFVGLLSDQPRAGATCPGRPRLVLEPPESHGDHCWAVAVFGVLAAPLYDADPADAYLLGLAHHLHNAVLPDAGFTGEVLLGLDVLPEIFGRLEQEALAELPPPLAARIDALLPQRAAADTPVARTFHAVDVLDRVLQMVSHARQAAFTVDQATDELELVHDGPVQAFQQDVLAQAGLPGGDALGVA